LAVIGQSSDLQDGTMMLRANVTLGALVSP
jgi:hypothetical protein